MGKWRFVFRRGKSILSYNLDSVFDNPKTNISDEVSKQ